jgi:hypothetical protein
VSRKLTVTIVSVGMVVIAALGLLSCVPGGYDSYRQAAVEAARQSMGSVRTAQLIGQVTLAGQALPPYASRALTDALGRASSAMADLTAQAIPDDRSRSLRDQLVPLLSTATGRVGDIQSALSAGEQENLREQVRTAAALGHQLNSFVRRYQ